MADLLAGALFLGLCIFVFLQARLLPPSRTAVPGPELFPELVAIFGAILAVLLIVRAVRSLIARGAVAPSRAIGSQPRLWRGSLLLGLSAVYALAMPTVGFLSSSFAFLALAMLSLGVRRPHVLIPLAAALAGAIYYLFGILLRVRLPAGLFI
jgi:putative tricarboxylic transport membrane protein